MFSHALGYILLCLPAVIAPLLGRFCRRWTIAHTIKLTIVVCGSCYFSGVWLLRDLMH